MGRENGVIYGYPRLAVFAPDDAIISAACAASFRSPEGVGAAEVAFLRS